MVSVTLMKRKKLFIAGGVILALIILAAGYTKMGNKSDGEETFKVEKQNLTEIISEVGKVVPVKKIELAFPVTGTISQILVKEGDKVAKGAVLARLNTQKTQADLESAQAKITEAQARLDKLNAGAGMEDVKVSETAVKNAENTLEKIKLAAQNNKTLAEAGVKSSQTALTNAENDLADQQKENEEDLKQAYEDALDTLKSSNTKADTALKTIDYIQEKYFNSQQPIDSKITDSEKIADDKFAVLAPIVAAAKISDFESVDTALSEMLSFLNNLADTLKVVRDEIETRIDVSPTVTDNGYVDTDRTNINTAITNTTGAIQTITSAELDNETSERSDQAALDTAKIALSEAEASLSAVQAEWDSKVSDAEGALKLAKDQLALKKAPARTEDIAIYEAQLKQAVAYVGFIQQTLNDSILQAPSDGFVTEINSEAGELASLTKTVVSMIAKEQYQIESYISELDIAFVAVSDPVEISFDAFGSDKIFKGHVVKIDPYETLIDGDVYYKVVIGFDEYDGAIRLGMTADIKIKTAEKENVLVAPSRFVGEEGGKKYVKIPLKNARDGEDPFTKIEITTGLKGEEMTEILSGLTEGQEIIPYY